MPELPEVETVVRGLRASLPGRRILSVRFRMTDFIEDPSGLERDLPGSSIEDVSRYGKYVVLQLSGAACPPTAGGDGANPERGGAGADHAGKRARSFLLVHLGMTGQLVPRRPEEPVAPHTLGFF
jgi:formamidopyrimidine-DNA glycosylase